MVTTDKLAEIGAAHGWSFRVEPDLWSRSVMDYVFERGDVRLRYDLRGHGTAVLTIDARTAEQKRDLDESNAPGIFRFSTWEMREALDPDTADIFAPTRGREEFAAYWLPKIDRRKLLLHRAAALCRAAEDVRKRAAEYEANAQLALQEAAR